MNDEEKLEKLEKIDELNLNFSVEELKTVPELNFHSYIQIAEHLGKKIEEKYGIPKIVPLIQSAHESRNGNSGLARNHCNLFGIVATDSWKSKGGAIALMQTWEVIKGKRIDLHREFRAYHDWFESFEDWARIITTLSVYKKAYEFFKQNSIREGITEMAKVYATDPAYARKLLEVYGLVEKHLEIK